jgi:uncharacterized protein YhaN
MRFERIFLTAFGSFRDRIIELPQAVGGDCHVFFGANEAGKSTLLRAVTGFLFGIPERTSDAFQFDYPALRVGATVRLAGGERLSLMRRKARKDTLRAIDATTGAEITERPLDDALAARLVGGLDVDLYRSLFGLDLNGLLEGGNALLDGQGEIGRSLFQAAGGLKDLRRVSADFDAEAEKIFKPRGSVGRLNQALAKADELKKLVRDKAVRSSAWDNAERERLRCEAELEQMSNALVRANAERERLRRIRGNLPLLAERTAKRQELDSLAAVRPLPEDAVSRRVKAQEQLRAAEDAARETASRLQRLHEERATLQLRDAMVEQATRIEAAYHRLDSFRAARDGLPHLERDLERERETQTKLAHELGANIDELPRLLPPETLRARVSELSDDFKSINVTAEQLDGQLKSKRAALDQLGKQLADIGAVADLDTVDAALLKAATAGELERRAGELQRELSELRSMVSRETLELWSGSLAELHALPVPLAETAAEFEREFSDLAAAEAVADNERTALLRDLSDRRRELKTLAAAGEVVTQADVASARLERDQLWATLRAQHIDRAAPPRGNSSSEAADTFTGAMHEADRRADLLHADTKRATQAADLQQRIDDMAAKQRTDLARAAEITAQRKQLQKRWAAVVAPLRRTEMTPGALREWLPRRQRLLERSAQAERLAAEQKAVSDDLSRTRGALEQALHALGQAPAAATERATEMLERLQGANKAAREVQQKGQSLVAQIDSGTSEFDQLQIERQASERKLVQVRGSWAATAEALRLPPDALPAEAQVRLDQFQRIETSLKTSAKIDLDVRAKRDVIVRFESELVELAAAAGEPANWANADAVAERLYMSLDGARKAERRRQQLDAEIEREQRDNTNAQDTAARARADIDSLVQQAGLASSEHLPEYEQAAAHKKQLDDRLREIDEQLRAQNAQPVDEVVRESGAATLDQIAHQLAERDVAIDELGRQRDSAYAALLEARRAFVAIDGGSAAAEAQDELRAVGAEIANCARTYARARLAAAVLERVVKQYRDRHEGPLLKRAGELFARITAGSFNRLSADYDEDKQVLLGVRPNDERVNVAGMSQGTRDQLFLALRVAAIEQHIGGRGPFPVIVDDLLVQFDDDRALATLAVLTELSAKTQVLFFTHHQHLVELIGRAPFAPTVCVQRL